MSYIENIDSKKQRFKNSARQSKVKKSRLMHFEKKQYYFKQNICKNQYFVKKDLRACDYLYSSRRYRKLFLVRGKILERWSNAHYNISTKSSSTSNQRRGLRNTLSEWWGHLVQLGRSFASTKNNEAFGSRNSRKHETRKNRFHSMSR